MEENFYWTRRSWRDLEMLSLYIGKRINTSLPMLQKEIITTSSDFKTLSNHHHSQANLPHTSISEQTTHTQLPTHIHTSHQNGCLNPNLHPPRPLQRPLQREDIHLFHRQPPHRRACQQRFQIQLEERGQESHEGVEGAP